jgi:hypothetical protein
MIPISLPRYPERNHRTSWPRGTCHPVEASAWNLFWRYECRRCRHPLSTFQLTLPMILPQSRDVRRTSPLNSAISRHIAFAPFWHCECNKTCKAKQGGSINLHCLPGARCWVILSLSPNLVYQTQSTHQKDLKNKRGGYAAANSLS